MTGPAEDEGDRFAAFERLYELIARMNGQRTLAETLTAVVDGVVEGLGFGVAVVNRVMDDGMLEVVAVAGPETARAALLGLRRDPHAFDVEFAVAEHWGGLRYVPHDRVPADAATGWVPSDEDAPAVSGPDAWHPLDALFAPLTSSTGQLVGMLSVDLPTDGRLPGPLQRKLLEMFASQAGTAIDNARLTARLTAEHDLLLRERELLRASEQSFRLAFDGAGVGMALVGVEGEEYGRYLRVNAALCAITGRTADELLSRTFAELTHPDDLETSEKAFRLGVEDGQGVQRVEKRYVAPSGRDVWAAITMSVVRLDSGQPLYCICQVEDITARKAADAELARRASHDQLTGLLNRAALHDRLSSAVARARSGGSPGAVLFCDLDGFKAVNDTHGHDVGDRVLEIAAGRLLEQVRSTDTVARLGGDEFVVLTEAHSDSDLSGLAGRIGRTLAGEMSVQGQPVTLSVSIGIARIAEDTTNVEAVLRQADGAMYAAKAAGRNGYAFASRQGAGVSGPVARS